MCTTVYLKDDSGKVSEITRVGQLREHMRQIVSDYRVEDDEVIEDECCLCCLDVEETALRSGWVSKRDDFGDYECERV
jgi:hypothetical protein